VPVRVPFGRAGLINHFWLATANPAAAERLHEATLRTLRLFEDRLHLLAAATEMAFDMHRAQMRATQRMVARNLSLSLVPFHRSQHEQVRSSVGPPPTQLWIRLSVV